MLSLIFKPDSFMQRNIYFFLLLLIGQQLFAQTEPEKGLDPGAVFIDLAYAIQLPEADMKENFSWNSNVGARVGYLLPNNWLFALGGEWIFSDQVKTDVLAPLREANGNLIDITGRMGLTQLGQRGFSINGQVGRIFPLTQKGRRHCIEARLGLGYLQHWVRIRILGDPELLPQLTGDYLLGYDRRSSGLATQQYIGYKYMSQSKLVNLFVGLDFTQGFTKNRRVWNYDTRQPDTDLKLDLLLGLRAGFTIPFFIYTEKTRVDDLDFY